MKTKLVNKSVMENFQNFDARQRGFEAAAFEFVGVGHGGVPSGFNEGRRSQLAR